MPLTEIDLKKQRGRSLALPSFRLQELDTLCKFFQVERATAAQLCKSMRVPLFYVGDCAYYNEFALERAIYILTRSGGPGFVAPHSSPKMRGTLVGVPREVSDSLQQEIESPATTVELTSAQGRKMPPASRITNLLKTTGDKPRGRPPKELKEDEQ